MPARWGLQQTTLAPGSNKTRARDPLVRLQVEESWHLQGSLQPVEFHKPNDRLLKIENYEPTMDLFY